MAKSMSISKSRKALYKCQSITGGKLLYIPGVPDLVCSAGLLVLGCLILKLWDLISSLFSDHFLGFSCGLDSFGIWLWDGFTLIFETFCQTCVRLCLRLIMHFFCSFVCFRLFWLWLKLGFTLYWSVFWHLNWFKIWLSNSGCRVFRCQALSSTGNLEWSDTSSWCCWRKRR